MPSSSNFNKLVAPRLKPLRGDYRLIMAGLSWFAFTKSSRRCGSSLEQVAGSETQVAGLSGKGVPGSDMCRQCPLGVMAGTQVARDSSVDGKAVVLRYTVRHIYYGDFFLKSNFKRINIYPHRHSCYKQHFKTYFLKRLGNIYFWKIWN